MSKVAMRYLDGVQREGTYFKRYRRSWISLMQAFVEFFTNEKQWQKILETIKEDRCISFYAGNNKVTTLCARTDIRVDL